MKYDIIIVGGGIVGQTLALALARETALTLAIIEAKSLSFAWSSESSIFYHHRVSAISLASQRIFENLNVWDSIQQKRVSPFTNMHVLDAKAKGKIEFDSREIAENVLGYIIENNVIQSSLAEKIKTYTQIKVIAPITPLSFSENENGIEIRANDGNIYQTKCLIAADGANSWVREEAGIAIDQYDYGQAAIVATVETRHGHRMCARQVFLENGPLAFLPLAEDALSSIVWTLPQTSADHLMKLDDAAFISELQAVAFPDLGAIIHVDKRYQFPLRAHQVKQYVKGRLALVGDAAHTIHPLAGQGVNMGLLDAAALSEVMIDAFKSHRDFSHINHLRRYERWRKADNLMMQKSVHALSSLFNKELSIIQQIRSFGLDMTNQTQIIKNIFTRYAVGKRDGLPKLAMR